MQTLSEILECARSGGRPDYEDMRYALCVLSAISAMDHSDFRQMVIAEQDGKKINAAFRHESVFDRWKRALAATPKEYLGKEFDPDSPDNQERRLDYIKFFDEFMKRR